jgi:non-ribosomal peptide synthetase component E (peptide arylation enzyme)
MKAMAIAITGAILGVTAANADDAPARTSPATALPRNVCLWTYQIDHTSVPDENTIVFHMKGGETWVNKLANRCSGLKFYGFSYDVRGPSEICGNQQSIRVLKTGAVCLLGPFTQGEVKPVPAATP